MLAKKWYTRTSTKVLFMRTIGIFWYFGILVFLKMKSATTSRMNAKNGKFLNRNLYIFILHTIGMARFFFRGLVCKKHGILVFFFGNCSLAIEKPFLPKIPKYQTGILERSNRLACYRKLKNTRKSIMARLLSKNRVLQNTKIPKCIKIPKYHVISKYQNVSKYHVISKY